MVAQETLLVRVEYGYKRHLGQVESLAQQVHAYEHVIDSGAEPVENLDAVEGVDVAVDVCCLDAELEQVLVQLLCHALGESGDKRALAALYAQVYLLEQVVNLVERRAYLYDGVEKACGADLLHDYALAALQLVVGRGGADIDHLIGQCLELLELEGAVVECGLEAESVVDEVDLPRQVAAVHGAALRQGDMTLIDDGEVVLREIVKQAEGTHAGLASVEISRVVLDARAVAHLAQHLDIVCHTLKQTLGLKLLADVEKVVVLLAEVNLNLSDGGAHALGRGHEQVCGIYLEHVMVAERDAVLGVNGLYGLNLIAPERDPHDNLLVCQAYVHGIPLDAECAAGQLDLVARV